MDDEKKKPTRRSKVKYPALNKRYNLKIRAKEIDYDYLDKLNDEEKEWLNQFTEEFVNASFKKNKDPLHNTPKLKKSCTDKNNSRNRCILSLQEVNFKLAPLSEIMKLENPDDNEMDDMIETLDTKLTDPDS